MFHLVSRAVASFCGVDACTMVDRTLITASHQYSFVCMHLTKVYRMVCFAHISMVYAQTLLLCGSGPI